jgi:glycosyltransferase involved in cell wall biosynthesis
MEATIEPRVALVHDWLTGMRGGEKCLEVLCRLWPTAELYTLLHQQGSVSKSIERLPIHTSFLQHLPGVGSYYRHLLPLMPAAVSSLRLPSRYDALLSLSHCVAKSVRAPLGVPHICYCFTPMRYAWQMREDYLRAADRVQGAAFRAAFALLRAWDRATSERVDHFIAISRTVQDRIRECYGRASTVIYPPVNTEYYRPAKARREDYYFVVSALVPYKRIEVAIAACTLLKRHLLVIGAGPEERRLRSCASPWVNFAGWQPNDVIRHHLQRCRALIFPGVEDFGMVPVEANACGAPVIAFGRGGAAETVLPLGGSPAPTGVWFDQQTPERLVEAVLHFEQNEDQIDPLDCRQQALRFHRERFESEIVEYVRQVIGQRRSALRFAEPTPLLGRLRRAG